MLPDYRKDNPYQHLLAKALENQGISISFMKGYKRVFPLYRYKKKKGFNIIHLHWLDPFFKGQNSITKMVYGLKLLIDIYLVSSNYRIIWTIHNLYSHDSQFKTIEKWIYIRVSKISSYLIVHNQWTLKEVSIQYRIKPDKLVCIPHGHYQNVYEPLISKGEARRKLRINTHASVFLHFGMIKPYKGIDELIKCWNADWGTLLVIGKAMDESYGSYIQGLIENTSQVFWVNTRVPENEVNLYFSIADYVVFPFKNITTSGSLLLAITFGKSVIIPRIQVFEELLGNEYPLYYNDLDEIERLATTENKLKAEKIIKSKINDLSWNNIAEKTKVLYEAA